MDFNPISTGERYMKRLTCLFIVFLTILALPTYAFAADENTYRLDSLGLSIEIPEGYTVLTRDTSANDPSLDVFGLTKDDLDSLMTDGNIYLDAWDDSTMTEILVTMTKSELGDFNSLSDTLLLFLTLMRMKVSHISSH